MYIINIETKMSEENINKAEGIGGYILQTSKNAISWYGLFSDEMAAAFEFVKALIPAAKVSVYKEEFTGNEFIPVEVPPKELARLTKNTPWNRFRTKFFWSIDWEDESNCYKSFNLETKNNLYELFRIRQKVQRGVSYGK